MKNHKNFFVVLLYLIVTECHALDGDNDGASDAEEMLAGTSDANPDERPYWWVTLNGNNSGDQFGISVDGVGDLNADGYDDFIVGASGADVNGSKSGSSYVYSGKDVSVLYAFHGDNAGDSFGYSVSGAGDVNNDGRADFFVGAKGSDINGDDSGMVKVFSGLDGAILYTINGDSAESEFGDAIDGAGDVNNDGYADLIVGAPLKDNYGLGDNENSGAAYILSGADGSTLYMLKGDTAVDYFGGSVGGAGDINNDGYDDFIVGATGDDNNGSSSGSATVYSGIDGSILYAFNGGAMNDQFGVYVSGTGDVNNDGYDDFIIGATGDDTNGLNTGSAKVFSGVNGAILYEFNGDDPSDKFGASSSAAGDVNSDGYSDLIVGAISDDDNGGSSGSARVFSGVNGTVLFTLYGDSKNDNFGRYSNSAGDVDNDGYDDLIVGAKGDDNNGVDSGSARIFLSSHLFNDPDTDYLVNSADSDDDNDGLLDSEEALTNTDALLYDTDGDGLSDYGEDYDGDGIPNGVEILKGMSPADSGDSVFPLNDVYTGDWFYNID